MEDTDNIMKNVFKCNDFVDVRTVRNKRKKKKKKVEKEIKDTTMSNNEGFAITGLVPDYVDIKDINGWQFKKKDIDEWNTFDFFNYGRRLYIKKYKEDWILKKGGNSLEIKKVFEKLEKKFGSVNNLLMKDYIIFFFEKHIDDFIRKNGDFYFSQLKRKDIITSFYNSYDYKKKINKYYKDKSKKNKNTKISNVILEKSYLLGESTLIMNYGVIISLNWLIIKKKMEEKEAEKLIIDVCKNIYRKGLFNIVVKSTESNSPYPSWMIFKNIEKILCKIDEKIKVNIKFIENEKNKLDFLRKGG